MKSSLSGKITTIAGVTINTPEFNKLSELLWAFAHPVRQDMMKEMDKSKGGCCNVSHLYKKFKLEQAVASQHLAILKRAGLVSCERKGKEMLYSVNGVSVSRVKAACEQVASV
jgi:DNA-binding transcriptional ArsR family regulator